MRLFMVVVVCAAPAVARAADSTWLVCRGKLERAGGKREHIVVSAFEHRGSGGDSRDLSVTLLKGMHASSGTINDKKSGAFVGKAAPLTLRSHGVVMSGTASLSSDFKGLTLRGKIAPTYEGTPKQTLEAFEAKLTCEELDDLVPD